MSKSLFLVMVGALILTVACGGSGSGTSSSSGSGSGSVNNVAAITVDGGPLGNYSEAAFATVTICVPNTSTCQTINHLLVDTGSYGLRILASGTSNLSITLPKETSGGNTVVECAQFVSFVTWGPVEMADVKISGEIAHNMPIQIIGDPNFPDSEVPAACLSSGVPSADNLSGLGSNGILGIGVFPDDCGTGCEALPTSSNNPGIYYTCPSSGCKVTALASEAQNVQNPVSSFSQDNNGTIVELPSIATTGAATANGSLVFGIGTQSNNGLNGATVLPLSAGFGDFSTIYPATSQGISYPSSFVDSGSTGLFFLTTSITGIQACADNCNYYCPSTTQTLSAINQGSNSSSTKVTSFTVANADNLNGNDNAFNDLAGPNPPSSCPSSLSSTTSPPAFDWGLSFFFGRNVYTAIYGEATPGGTGPYVAY